ncbi:MAG: branched-chain amino acid transport system / permease component family protein [Rhodospirillales bacterium]|nr:branched-chain amino acid transport system / permease component family protein [Rhodospirillales bacterium]
MSIVLPLLVDGLAEAALIFFVAVGLTLVFSVLRILNVAHGSFYSIGAYVAVLLGTWVIGRGYAPALTFLSMLLAAALVAVVLGPAIERSFVRWTYGRPEAVQILVTFALFLIFEDLQKLAFGVQPYSQDAPMQLLGVSSIAGVVYLNYSIALIVLAVAVAAGLRLLLARTRFGKLVTAVVADREVAQTLGINTERVFVSAFTLGVFLAALGGALASATSGVAPGLGAEAIVLGFAVAAIGGLGQIEGALLAAVIVGISRVVAIYFMPELQPVAPYLVMLTVLLVRPFGLFGSPAMRRL